MIPTLLLTLLLVQAPAFPEVGQQDPSTEGATLEGFIVRLGTSTPVTRAAVTLVPVQGGQQSAATTDGSGRFSFSDVEPGSYRISADRNGYVHTEYGQRYSGFPGTTLVLRGGDTRSDIVVGMTQTGVISGRVYDQFGEPVVNATVQALRHVYQNGKRVLSTVSNAMTNDLGEYRLFWMEPGEYVVSVTPVAQSGQYAILENVVVSSYENFSTAVRVQRGGAVPPPPPPPPPVGWTNRAPTPRFAPLYYPGTTDPASAALIDLGAGIDYSGVDLLIVETATVTVRGRVVAGSGSVNNLRGATVRLVPRSDITLENHSVRTGSVDEDGIFEINDVIPGSYDLVAALRNQVYRSVIREGGQTQENVFFVGRGGVGNPGENPQLYARIPLQVGSADIEGVTLTLAPGYNLQGQVVVDETNLRFSGLNLQLQGERVLYGVPTPQPQWGENWAFTLENVPPSDYILSISGLPANAYVVEARLGTEDVLNGGLNLNSEPLGRLEVVVAVDGGSLDAVAVDAAGEPTSGVRVVLVPNAPRRQRLDLYDSALSDDSGTVRFEGIAPGDYKVFSWEQVESGAWQHPDFIRNHEDRGETVRIGSLGSETATVRLIAAGD